ncbi:MAG: IS1380 family transposase [Calditrichia bacterium]
MNNDQLELKILQDKKLTLNFDGGDIVSDSGLLLIKAFEKKLGLINKIAGVIHDPRDQGSILHTMPSLVSQRIYQIIAGYEDANDCDLLRKDPCFKALSDKKPSDEDLASQPTMARLENRCNRRDVVSMMKLLPQLFVDHYQEDPKEITIDVDGTAGEAHGHQQMALFHGYYKQYQYYPLIISAQGHLLGAVLRKGTCSQHKHVYPMLNHIIKVIRERFPNVKIIIRADAGFSSPRFYDYLDSIEDLVYYVGVPSNEVLKKETISLTEKVQRAYDEFEGTQKEYTEFSYAAKSWSKEQRIIAKVEINGLGQNIRYITTNDEVSPPKEAYPFYGRRGESECWIGDFKNGFSGDRLSCHRFIANQVRILIHAFAYELMILFKTSVLRGTELATQSIESIRTKLIKVGAQVHETARRVWFRCASNHPYRSLFETIGQKILSFQ